MNRNRLQPGRYTAVFLSTLTLLTTSACRTEQRVNSRGPVTDAAFIKVPLPANTPFDGVADGRVEYLKAYQEGYCSGLPTFGPFCPYGRVGIADARSRGWHDGAFAARMAEALKIKTEQPAKGY